MGLLPQLSMEPDMPLTPPHTPSMVLLTSSAREKLKLTLKPSHGWHTPTTVPLTSSARDLLTPNQNPTMELTDTLPHTPMVDTDHTDTLLTVHTPTDVYMVPTTDTIEQSKKY